MFLPSDQITALHARHKWTLFCRELPLVPLSCPHSPLVSRSHMWHGGRGRLLRALLRRGIVWTSSSELSEVASELSASASGFAVRPSGLRGIGWIHSSSLDDSPLQLLANGFVFRAAGRPSHGIEYHRPAWPAHWRCRWFVPFENWWCTGYWECDAKLTKIPKRDFYFRTCEDGAGWHLIPYTISPRSEFFSQAYKNWHITWGINLGPDWPPLARGSKFHTIHTPTRPLSLPSPR